MKAVLSVESVALQSGGSLLSFELPKGHSAGIVGPGASGKTRLLRVLAGLEKPASGQVVAHGRRVAALDLEAPRRATPLAIAKHAAGQNNQRAADAIGVMRLGDVRNDPVADLSPSQRAAAQLLAVLASPAPVLLIDGLLDLLDPWAFEGAVRLLRSNLAHGAVLVASTHRPDLLLHFDSLVVLSDGEVRFQGTLDDALRRVGPHEVEVETRNPSAARSMAGPLALSVAPGPKGLTLTAADGQELAAKLLLEGYGDVRAVLVREPTPQEALLKLL